jgi:hypothetical protein
MLQRVSSTSSRSTRSSGDAALIASHPVMEFLLQLHTDMFLRAPGVRHFS